MNITFLIGNGFDVGIGMKSKFKDFFPVYQKKSTNKPEQIRQLADEIGDNYDTWADFETALGKYTLSFNSDKKQDFIDQVKDFELEFIEYLRNQEDSLKFDENKDIEISMKNALLKYYLGQNLAPESCSEIMSTYTTYAHEEHVYNFVNFNYTFTLEKCLETISQKIVCKRRYGNTDKVDRIGAVVHVHGNCDLYPIIGVNDLSQIMNNELSEDEQFTRFFVKPSLNKLLRQGNDTKATNIINKSTIICVYGMSLGETDKKWWTMLIRWLSENQYRQLIVFDYDENYTTFTQFDWLEKEDTIIAKLKQYNMDSRIKIELLRSRIHVAVHKNIFSMSIPKKDKNE